MKQQNEVSEWERIQIYQSALADAFRTVLEIAPGHLAPETKAWLQQKYVTATDECQEAYEKMSQSSGKTS